jgi:hypothetical protein
MKRMFVLGLGGNVGCDGSSAQSQVSDLSEANLVSSDGDTLRNLLVAFHDEISTIWA